MVDKGQIREALDVPSLEAKLVALDNGRPFNLDSQQIANLARGELQIEGIISRDLSRNSAQPIELSAETFHRKPNHE